MIHGPHSKGNALSNSAGAESLEGSESEVTVRVTAAGS